jgi:hypothetical protein
MAFYEYLSSIDAGKYKKQYLLDNPGGSVSDQSVSQLMHLVENMKFTTVSNAMTSARASDSEIAGLEYILNRLPSDDPQRAEVEARIRSLSDFIADKGLDDVLESVDITNDSAGPGGENEIDPVLAIEHSPNVDHSEEDEVQPPLSVVAENTPETTESRRPYLLVAAALAVVAALVLFGVRRGRK